MNSMTRLLFSFTTMPKWTKEGASRGLLSMRLPCWVWITMSTFSCSQAQTPTSVMPVNVPPWDSPRKQAT